MDKKIISSGALFALVVSLVFLWHVLDPLYPNVGGGGLLSLLNFALTWFFVGVMFGSEVKLNRKLSWGALGLVAAMLLVTELLPYNYELNSWLRCLSFLFAGASVTNLLEAPKKEWGKAEHVVIALLVIGALWYFGCSWQAREILVPLKSLFGALLMFCLVPLAASIYAWAVSPRIQARLAKPRVIKVMACLSVILSAIAIGLYPDCRMGLFWQPVGYAVLRQPVVVAAFCILLWMPVKALLKRRG